jgi:hypothetical protein
VQNVKDAIGVVMRVIDGAEISKNEVLALEFGCDGYLLVVSLIAACPMSAHERRR